MSTTERAEFRRLVGRLRQRPHWTVQKIAARLGLRATSLHHILATPSAGTSPDRLEKLQALVRQEFATGSVAKGRTSPGRRARTTTGASRTATRKPSRARTGRPRGRSVQVLAPSAAKQFIATVRATVEAGTPMARLATLLGYRHSSSLAAAMGRARIPLDIAEQLTTVRANLANGTIVLNGSGSKGRATKHGHAITSAMNGRSNNGRHTNGRTGPETMGAEPSPLSPASAVHAVLSPADSPSEAPVAMAVIRRGDLAGLGAADGVLLRSGPHPARQALAPYLDEAAEHLGRARAAFGKALEAEATTYLTEPGVRRMSALLELLEHEVRHS